jgi:hypothetical protein
MSDLKKCHRGFINNINVLKHRFVLLLFVCVLDYDELYSLAMPEGIYVGLMLVRITRNSRLHGPLRKGSRATGCALPDAHTEFFFGGGGGGWL